MNVSDYIIESLANQGVRDIFLLPGGGCMYLIDAVAKSSRINPYPMLHEQSVGIAAESYAQYGNNIGVAIVTTGPGATNAVTPCAAAWTDSTPMIFISGQVKTQDFHEKFGVRQLGFQEVPITQIVGPITKKAIRVTSAEQVPEALQELVKIARSDRPGPVWLDIPLDIQGTEIQVEPLGLIPAEPAQPEIESKLLYEIIEAWGRAERPLLLLGNGVRLSGSVETAIALSKLTNTPTLLTWKTIDFMSDDDPLNAGRPGAIAQRWSNFAQQTADFILVLGARLDLGQTSYRPENFAPNATKFIVDVDFSELRKLEVTKAELIESDVKIFLDSLVSLFSMQGIKPKGDDWRQRIMNWKLQFPLLQEKHLHPKSGTNLYQFIQELSQQMQSSDLLIPGSSGACSEIAMQAFKVKKGQRIFNSEGLGPMGFGIPASIGGCIASGKRRTISIDGDGGFLMNVQELATLKFYNLPVKIFVLNNDGYGSIKTSQDHYFEGRRLGTDRSSGLGLPNLEKMIKGFEMSYHKITSADQLPEVISDALNENGPTIVEILVDPDQITEPRTYTEVDHLGNFVTSPMERLTPLIPEDVLARLLSR